MGEKKKQTNGPVHGGGPQGSSHGPSTTDSSTSVAQSEVGNQATVQVMGLGAPLQFGQVEPFNYYPGESLDVVYPTASAGVEAIATALYGNAALSGQLEPTDGPRGPGYRFDPGLLLPNWRSVYYENQALQTGRQERDDLNLNGMFLVTAPGEQDIFSPVAPKPQQSQFEAVVVYLPAAIPQLGGTGSQQGSPSITMNGFAPSAPGLSLAPVQQGEQPAHTRNAYDPRTHYGPSVGDLSHISNQPDRYRDLLDGPDDRMVVVEVSASGFPSLVAARSTRMTKAPSASPYLASWGTSPLQPFGNMGQGQIQPMGIGGGQSLGSQNLGSAMLGQGDGSNGGGGLQLGTGDRDMPDLQRLDRMLPGSQAQIFLRQGSSHLGGNGGGLGGNGGGKPVLVLMPEGPNGFSSSGRYQIASGQVAMQAASMGGGAPTYLWSGGSRLSPIQNGAALSLLAPTQQRGPSPFMPMSPMNGMGSSPLSPLSLLQAQNPLSRVGMPTPMQQQSLGTFESFQVLSIGELGDAVRRHRAQQMMKSAVNEDGKMVEADGGKLVDMSSESQFVIGTNMDRHARVDTGADKTPTLDLGGVPDRASASPEEVQDLLDLSLFRLSEIGHRAGKAEIFIEPLMRRIRSFQGQLAADPSQAGSMAAMAGIQLRLISGSTRALSKMPVLRRRYRGSDKALTEVREIENLFGLSLAYSDQTATATRFFETASRRLVLLPLVVIRERSSESDENIRELMRHEGDGSILMGTDVEEERDDVREISKESHSDDMAALKAAILEVNGASARGDIKAASVAAQRAAELDQKLIGRMQIMQQLHQALLTFQHMGESSAKYVQMFSSSDEKLESLMGNLKGHLKNYEAAKTPEARVDVMEAVAQMWKSDADYQAFYEEVYEFIGAADKWVGFGIRLAIVVAAGLLTMGVGSAVAGSGLLAAEGIGMLALEAATFTVANAAGEAMFFSEDYNEGIIGLEQEDENWGEYGLDMAGDYAFNLATFGMMKGIGTMWKSFGIQRAGMRAAGEMATGFAAFEALGVGQHWAAEGELPDMMELANITGQNIAMLGTMHLAGRLARPYFEGLQYQVAKRAGNFEGQMRLLESRRMGMEKNVTELLKEAKKSETLDEATAGELSAKARGLEAEVEALQTRMAKDSKFQNELAKDPIAREQFNNSIARLRRSAQIDQHVIFANKAGLRGENGGMAVGTETMLFDPGKADMVVEFYQQQGYQVRRSTSSDGKVEIVAKTQAGEALFLREARTTQKSEFAEANLKGAEANPVDAYTHSGIEVHNHMHGILTGTEVVQLMYGGNYGKCFEIIRRGFEADMTSARAKVTELRSRRERATEANAKEAIDIELRQAEASMRELEPIELVINEAKNNPERLQELLPELLEAGQRVRFDKAYDLRSHLRDSFTPAQNREWVQQNVKKLAQDGVKYVELQGRAPKGMTEAEFVELCRANGVEVKFLENILTFELAKQTTGQGKEVSIRSAEARVREHFHGKDFQGPMTKAEYELVEAMQRSQLTDASFLKLMKAMKSPSNVGFDVCGPEKADWTGAGAQRISAMLEILQAASKAMGRNFVLRPHVGEGYVESVLNAPNQQAAKGQAAETARNNLDVMLTALEQAGYTPGQGVIVRLGHVTHATSSQIMRMKNLGVTAEANIMSNKATEAVTAIHDHPLLELIYRDVPTLLSTDAGGVMNTSMQMDTNAAGKIIEAYKLGQTQMLVDGRVVTYESLPSNIQRRYSVEYLNKAAKQYLQEIRAAGNYPSGYATPVPGALDDER
jgi:hypothetical protein